MVGAPSSPPRRPRHGCLATAARRLGLGERISEVLDQEHFLPATGQGIVGLTTRAEDAATRYFAIYLTPELSKGAAVGISDVWGHYHSRIVDDNELISYWAAHQLGPRMSMPSAEMRLPMGCHSFSCTISGSGFLYTASSAWASTCVFTLM